MGFSLLSKWEYMQYLGVWIERFDIHWHFKLKDRKYDEQLRGRIYLMLNLKHTAVTNPSKLCMFELL